jgi:hypothetical protein
MNRFDAAPHRVLVVANETCPCPVLTDVVAARAADPPAEVLIVAPALNSRLRHWVSDIDAAVSRARERVGIAVAALRERGVTARGEVGDADPLLAIADALARFPADELVVATHPAGRSHWLERRLIERARGRFGLPVLHVESDYGLIDAAAVA